MRNLNYAEQLQVSGGLTQFSELPGGVTESLLAELRTNAGIRGLGALALGFPSREPIALPGTLPGVGANISLQLPYRC